jgi:hypothetical protein
VKLLAVLWANLSDGNRIPAEAHIRSFRDLEAAARGRPALNSFPQEANSPERPPLGRK